MESVLFNGLGCSVLPQKPSNLFKKSSMFCQMKKKKKVMMNTGRIGCVMTQRTSSPVDDHENDNKLVSSPNGIAHHYAGNACNGIGINKFLEHKNLFITGATGFLGKVLIEKILRTIPNVGRIFVLIKAKNKEDAMNRIKSEIIKSEIFKGLRNTHGKSYEAFIMSKLVPVAGNVCHEDLGLQEDMTAAIARDVDIIVGSAANTTFDERYDVAIETNTRGPCRLMSFAKRCTKLKLFMHISTAYVNGKRRGRITETLLRKGENIAPMEGLHSKSPTLNIEAEMRLAFQSRDASHEDMKQLGLERANKFGWNDTYTFTKAMGEMMIGNIREDIPVVILRPTIIESTFREPFSGWIQGNRMMDPIILSYGKGRLTGFLANPDVILDVVPVDMVVNAILAAIARHGMTIKSDINVYHFASSVVNPLIFGHSVNIFYEHFKKLPYISVNGSPVPVTPMKLFDSMDELSAHLWRNTIQQKERDSASTNANQSKKLENIEKRSVEHAKYLSKIYEPYLFYDQRYEYDISNTERLMKIMSEEERRDFGFDLRSIDWNDYISNVHIPGLRRHVLQGRGSNV